MARPIYCLANAVEPRLICRPCWTQKCLQSRCSLAMHNDRQFNCRQSEPQSQPSNCTRVSSLLLGCQWWRPSGSPNCPDVRHDSQLVLCGWSAHLQVRLSWASLGLFHSPRGTQAAKCSLSTQISVFLSRRELLSMLLSLGDRHLLLFL